MTKRNPRAMRMPAVPLLLAALLWLNVAVAAEIPIVDAHSQVDFSDDMDRIVGLMDEAGVARTLLVARREVKPQDVLALAGRHPGRIVPSVRTKGGKYTRQDPDFFQVVKQHLQLGGFAAMAEVLMWHAEKFNRKGQSIAAAVVAPPDDGGCGPCSRWPWNGNGRS